MNSREKLQAALYAAATECLNGNHGDGDERIHSLKQNGFSDDQIRRIQDIVNGRVTIAIKKYTDKMEF
mgnify:CR=1 FL=1